MNAKERKKEVEVEEEEEAQGKERTERTERGFDHRTQTLRARLCSAFHVLTRRTQKKVNSFCSRDLVTINLSLSLSNASSRLAKRARSANYFRGRERERERSTCREHFSCDRSVMRSIYTCLSFLVNGLKRRIGVLFSASKNSLIPPLASSFIRKHTQRRKR